MVPISVLPHDSQAADRAHFSGFLQLLKLRMMCTYGVFWDREAIKNALINTFEGKLCSLVSRFSDRKILCYITKVLLLRIRDMTAVVRFESIFQKNDNDNKLERREFIKFFV